MSELVENRTLILIQRKFNDISQKLFKVNNCEVLDNVNTDMIGNLMIENFRFNN